MMSEMVATTRLHLCRFRAYFELEQQQFSIPVPLCIPESLVIPPVYDEFHYDVGVSLKSPGSDRVVDNHFVGEENYVL